MGYGKKSGIPYVNRRKASNYLKQKGVETAFIFGSGLKVANPKHDLDIAVDLPPTKKNKETFSDATEHGIDLFLIETETLFSVGCDDFLYTDGGDLQDLESVKAKRFHVLKQLKQHSSTDLCR